MKHQHLLKFSSERELQTLLFNRSQVLFGVPRRDLIVRKEVYVIDCIPDFVCVRKKTMQSPPHKWPRDWNYFHANVIRLLLGRTVGQAILSQELFTPQQRIAKVLKDLTLSEMIREGRDGGFRVTHKAFWLSTEVLAIEAKLTRWREAVAQAVSYKKFAERVALAIQAATYKANESKLRDAVREHKIGLCVASPGAAEWIVLPPRDASMLTGQHEYVVGNCSRTD